MAKKTQKPSRNRQPRPKERSQKSFDGNPRKHTGKSTKAR